MFPNLRAEMARYEIKTKDVAEALNVSHKTINNKLSGKTPFMLQEALRIRDNFFPKASLEYLFTTEEKTEQAS